MPAANYCARAGLEPVRASCQRIGVTILSTFTRPQMYSCVIDDLTVNVNGPDPFVDADWEAYVLWTEDLISRGIPVKGALTFSPFQSPNAAQRERLRQSLQKGVQGAPRVAVLSDSAMVRGAMTALSWFIKSVHAKGYRPMESDLAMTWLAQQLEFDAAEVRAALKKGTTAVGFTTQDAYRWFP